MSKKVHWEYRHQKLAIAKFWTLWILGLLLLVPMLVLKLLANTIDSVCVWIVRCTEFTPWELTGFLRKSIAEMKEKESQNGMEGCE